MSESATKRVTDLATRSGLVKEPIMRYTYNVLGVS